MIQFFIDLFNPDLSFLLYATLVGILSSFAFGTIGTFVVIKRISFIGGAISHCVLGGIGLGIFLSGVYHLQWFTPQLGAIIFAIASAILIGFFTIYKKEIEDTLIGALWAIGMALGLLFIHYTPGISDPMGYLFGSIIMVTSQDLILVILLDLLIILTTFLFFNKFKAICFDEEFARLRGINTKFYYILLLILISLTIVTFINIVGIVMVIALLTIPAGIANFFASNIKQMIMISISICMLTVISGLALSYQLDAPSGPVIIVLNGIFYFVATRFLSKKIS